LTVHGEPPRSIDAVAAAGGPPTSFSARSIGDVILAIEHVSLSFGGVKALQDVSFDVREHEVRAMPAAAASCVSMPRRLTPWSVIVPFCGR
jgi:hypothetical protein